MNNLTTRKIVFGMLVTFILAFGVQGIADAVLTPKENTEDADFIFTDGSTPKSDNFTFTVTASSVAENETLTVSPGGATITNITATGFTRSGNVLTAGVNVSDGAKTVTVSYSVAGHAKYTFSVGGTTVFTAYALVSDRARSSIVATPTPQVNGRGVDLPIAVTIAPWTQVDLSVSGGSFIISSGIPVITKGSGARPTSFSTFTTTGSSTPLASVRVNNNQTAKVTARIPGSNAANATRIVTYFFNPNVTLRRVSGNNQFGPINPSTTPAAQRKRLTNPLVVRVLDGTTRGVSEQDVVFNITSGTATLRAFSSANLGDSDSSGSITSVDDNRDPITVKTDRNGDAKVYLVPGSSAERYSVSVSVSGTTALLDPAGFTFTATAIQSISGGGGYEIDKNRMSRTPSTSMTLQTPQIRDPHNDSLMRVNVDTTGANDNVQNVQVDFTVTGGRLTLTPGSNYHTSLSTVTDANGDATVYVQLTGSSLAKATARIAGNYEDEGRHEVTYFYNYPYIEYVSGNNQRGGIGGRVQDPLVVRVLDGRRGRSVSGQIVNFTVSAPTGGLSDTGGARTFIPVSGTYVFVSALNTLDTTASRPASGSFPEMATATTPVPGAPISVQTDSSGEAQVYLRLGNGDNPLTTNAVEDTDLVHSVTATTPNGTPSDGVMFRNNAVDDARTAKLEIVSGNGQRADKGDPLPAPLVVRVKSTRGYLLANVRLRFTALDGTLDPHPDHNTVYAPAPNAHNTSGNEIEVVTASDGEAWVDYNIGQLGVARTVTVEVIEERGAGTAYDFEIDRVSFGVNGGRGTGGGTTTTTTTTTATRTITITPSSTTGEPGEEVDVIITSSPRGELVTINSGDLDDDDFSPRFEFTPFTTTILLPDEEDTYTFSATGPSGFTTATATITVESEEEELGTLTLAEVDDRAANGQQTVNITAQKSDGTPGITVSVTLAGPGFSRTATTFSDGSVRTVIPLPTTGGAPSVTLSATGYTTRAFTLRAPGQATGSTPPTTTTTTTTTTTPTVSEPDSITRIGPAARTGTVNEELGAALIVRVLDDDGDGIEDARVFYRVIEGRGRLSDATRSARRIGVITDEDGYARANFTPTDGGTHTVRVNTDDISDTVTFTITTGAAPPTTRTPGTGVTPGTTVSPVVHVGAAKRPSMLWVDGGAIYALVGADPQEFAPSVDNAMNIAVGGGKVYWTEKTGESGGTINSANLNGDPDVTELASIFATPIGIAVDAAGSKLYWTNSAGRIQSANLNGSGITNVLQNLDNPMDIALAGGNVYWTQGTGSVRFVNLRGQKVVRNISTGLDTPGSLVIGGGKVYWTEKTGESGGTINSANLNGTGAMELASILAVPMGIAVDTARSKLYWTNSRGRIQSANLDGSKIKNVVDGLGSPGELVLSNSIAAPTTTPTTPTTPTTASKYDVNRDGSVDNTDASLVAAAMNTSNARYDVNGDGTVNFLDLLLVFDNRDDNAAAAPTIVGMQLSAAQIDRIEEQIDLLIATGDRSPAAMRTLIYLQQLIVMARPEKTQLLANYPNPFNPETWIPYELATDTPVRITIYNTQGVVIRTLQLGQQSAGYYTDRDRAAYWDGRNALGEQVASGLYFYQFETDDMSSMRKMVILK